MVKRPEILKRITAWVIIFMLAAGSFGATSSFAAAETDAAKEIMAAETEEITETVVITEVEPLDTAVLNQEVVAYSETPLVLPEQITVKTAGSETFEPVNVEWTCAETYNGKAAGTYTFSGSVPEGYTFAEGVTLPEITVEVTKCETEIKGVAKTLTRKARCNLYDEVTVYNGYGSKLKLQMYNKKSGKWVTKRTVTLKNQAKQVLKVKYTNDWWKVTTSKWRLKIEPTAGKTGWTHRTTTVKTNRYYQNPAKYVQIQDNIKIDNSGAYTLKPGYMGLKVRQVNRYFDIGSRYWPRYTSQTKSKVRAFQKRHGLKATGNVNKAIWLAMGFSEYTWKNMGAYVSPIRVNPSSTKKDHIEAMISRAYDYMGADFVVGASGKPSQGADCSGIVMQALYAAGVEMEGINPATHSWAGHEYESRNMWAHANFKKISYSEKKRGDLIFYKGSSGLVNHVAIYLGNGKVIESWPNKVRVAPVGHHRIMGAMRVFN